MLQLITIFFLLPLLSGNSNHQRNIQLDPPPDEVIGLWVGKNTDEDNKETVWFDSFHPNGVLIIRFLNYEDGKLVEEVTEACSVHFEGDMKTVITHKIRFKEINGDDHIEDCHYVERYQILEQDSDNMVYEHQGTGHVYKIKKLSNSPSFKRSKYLTEDGQAR